MPLPPPQSLGHRPLSTQTPEIPNIGRQLNYFQQQYGLGFVLFAGLSGNAIEDLVLGNPLGYIRNNQLTEP
jgi:hypothetical protein